MKKKLSNHIIPGVLKAGVCMVVLSGSSPLMAQDETAAADSTEVIYNARAKKAPQYKMKEVKGKVTDASTHAPMGGVRVQSLNNPNYSTLTEEDGTYTLQVPYFVYALYIDAPEYNPVQLPIKGTEGQDAVLYSNYLTGYYGDNTSITAETGMLVDNSSSLTVETDMQNRMAGELFMVNRNGLPAQGALMLVRGIKSLNAKAQPLFIIDGVMRDMQENRSTLHEGYYNDLLAGIDPEEIEEVKVLKNATALYGAKGANGVVIINTKRGKSMATKIDVRIYGGFELAPKGIDMLNGEQFRLYSSDLVGTTDAGKRYAENNLTIPFLNTNPDYFWYPMFHNNTDWSDELYQTTFVQNYKVAVEGGDDVAMYRLSLGYASADATAKQNDFNRLNLRFNTDIKISDHIKASLDIAYNRNAAHILDNGWAYDYSDQNIGSPNVLGLIQTPFISKYDYYIGADANGTPKLFQSTAYAGKYAADASLYTSPSIQNPFNYASNFGENTVINNPYWILENGEGKNKNYAENTQFHLNAKPTWQINKHLSISDRFNYSLVRGSERYYIPRYGSSKYEIKNLGTVTSVLKSQFTKETSLNNDLQIAWANTYGQHDISVFGGWRYNNYSYSYSYLHAYNNGNDKIPNITKGAVDYLTYDGTNDNWIDMSYYAQADYNLRNKYFAQVGVSAQSSSRFGKNTDDGFQLAGVSWGVFPSVQLGWLISSEPWFKTGNAINYLKLTAGFDQSGNDDVDYYASRTYWSAQRFLRTAIGLNLANIENPKLQWETTNMFNIGLEGSFVNNRIHAGIDLFWSKTNNLLVQKDISYLTGLAKYWTNEGKLENKGLEANISAILLNRKNWRWEIGGSIGHYKNEITALPDGYIKDTPYKGYLSSIYGDKNILTAVGQAAGVFYGYQTAGVFADDEAARCNNGDYLKYPTGIATGKDQYKNFQAGDIHFIDRNNDGIIDEKDKTIIGDPNPTIYGNLFTSVSYKRLRLDVAFKYSLGNDVYNYQRSQIESGSSYYNQTTAMLNRWTYEGQQTNVPRAVYTTSDEWVNNERFSDRWIEDGSYLKLKNVRLTYDIPMSTTFLQGIKIWGEGNNLLTLTKYLGTDPESSVSNNIFFQGIDAGLLPQGRSFNIGVTINL